MIIKAYSKKFGFTMIEFLIACAMAGIVVIGTSSLYIGLQRVYINQARISQLQHQMRVSMNTMAREIRRAGYNPNATNATFGLQATGNESIYFTYDVDGNGTLDSNEKYKFRRNNNILEYSKNNGTVWDDLPGKMTGLTFHYYDNNGTATTTPGDTAIVQITITGRTKLSAGSDMYHYQTLNSRVKVRNLSD